MLLPGHGLLLGLFEELPYRGEASLLLAWVPVIGDPITFIAGVLRVPLWRFLVWVGLSKTARYALLVFGAMSV